MFKFSLVGVLTAHGFHVKGHCLISGNMSRMSPATHFITLLPSAVVSQGNASDATPPSKKCTACSSAFFLLLKPVIYPPYFLYSN